MAIQEWKKFDVMSVAAVSAVIGVIMGLIIGVVIALFSAALAFAVPGMIGFGIFSIIAFPILYGVLGFVGGAIGTVIYNFAASKVGGIKVTV